MHVTVRTISRPTTNRTLPAVILAAGEGFRLNGGNGSMPKPLTSVLGLTLLERAVLSCREIGIGEFYVVVGYRAEEMIPHIKALEQRFSVLIQPVENPNWNEGNGSSALTVAPYIDGPFFLLMCDHLFDPAILQHLLEVKGDTTDCLLGVDCRTNGIFDVDDATKVKLDGDVITAIGKGITSFDAIDTGLFLCQPSLFDGLREARREGYGSLSAGIMRLIRNREFRAVVIGDRFWLDVDTPESLAYAKRALLKSESKPGDDGFISSRLNRPISRKISGLLARSSVPPNGITLLSFMVCIIGAFMFSLGGYVWTVVAGLVIQLASIVDGCDGEIARLKFQSSRFGAWFDTVLDRYADTAIAVGVSYGYWMTHPHPAVWFGAILALTGFVLASYTKKEFEIRYETKPSGDVFSRLIKRDVRIFTIMLGALVNRPFEVLMLVGFLSHVGIALMFLNGYRQKYHRQHLAE